MKKYKNPSFIRFFKFNKRYTLDVQDIYVRLRHPVHEKPDNYVKVSTLKIISKVNKHGRKYFTFYPSAIGRTNQAVNWKSVHSINILYIAGYFDYHRNRHFLKVGCLCELSRSQAVLNYIDMVISQFHDITAKRVHAISIFSLRKDFTFWKSINFNELDNSADILQKTSNT